MLKDSRSIAALAGFVLATASALIAIWLWSYGFAVGGLAHGDPLLIASFRTGMALSGVGVLFALSGLRPATRLALAWSGLGAAGTFVLGRHRAHALNVRQCRAENRIVQAASGEGRDDLKERKLFACLPRIWGRSIAGCGNRRARSADRAGKVLLQGAITAAERNAADRRAVGGALGSQRGENGLDHECGDSRRSFSEDRHAWKLLRRNSARLLRYFDRRPRFFADLH